METLTESVEKTGRGAIVFDPSIIRKISDEKFTAAGWPHSEPIERQPEFGARSETMFVGNVPRQFVLRHFTGSGLLGKLLHDRFLWRGADSTRSFREWRMLAKMADRNLRVPRPAAARYCQQGAFYTADIITVRIPHVRPLSERLTEGAWSAEFWQSIGQAIHEFHDCGVYHSDMSAHTLQIDDDDRLWMHDFDRGQLLPPGAWQQQTLSRLHRSLRKLRALDPRLHYRRENWEQLLEGYFSASRPE
jgi:3-deoxy-D-manno-octulosonic acid kinase